VNPTVIRIIIKTLALSILAAPFPLAADDRPTRGINKNPHSLDRDPLLPYENVTS